MPEQGSTEHHTPLPQPRSVPPPLPQPRSAAEAPVDQTDWKPGQQEEGRREEEAVITGSRFLPL